MKNASVSLLALAAAAGASALPGAASAQDYYVGEIQSFGFSFCPRDWAPANGQALAIAQYQTLYAVMGGAFGGDWQTYMLTPDLRDRTPLHTGAGPGLSPYVIGQFAGSTTTTFHHFHLPQHSHDLLGAAGAGTNSRDPNGRTFRNFGGGAAYADASQFPPSLNMNADVITDSGLSGGVTQTNRQSFLTVNYCIATDGLFPSRN